MRRLLALFVVMGLLLSACGNAEQTNSGGGSVESDALTWGTCGSYGRRENFVKLFEETYPEIELEFISYAGGNATGYSWAQMRADDIPDIFITSQILDKELAKERLVDLSGYEFMSDFSTSLLDHVSIDGGVYLLPVSNTMYGILYNESLMEEHGWEVPSNYEELEALCGEIQEAGLIPGVVCTQLTGGPFSYVFNLAKTDWLTTPEGIKWEQDFLAGNATAAGTWESTMDYVQRYIDIGMMTPDEEDRDAVSMIMDYLGNRKAVFCVSVQPISITEMPDTGDKLGIMPYIGEEGDKNVYMYNPSCYFGISKRLTEPGNEEKLENAIKLLSLLFSKEGQATFVTEETPSVMSVIEDNVISEDALIYDAYLAMQDGRAFPMTYANWENVLADMGQAYKEWIRGENNMDGAGCIAKMDELQQGYLNSEAHLGFCESTADFTLEETAALIGKVLGSAAGADAVLVPLSEFHDGHELSAGVSGKLYAGSINTEVSTSIVPGYDGEYAMMTMTGAKAKELAAAGFDEAGDGNPFPYVLVTKGNKELEDNETYQVAFLMQGYTEETANAYNARVIEGSLREFLHAWFEEQKTVSPDGNPWE